MMVESSQPSRYFKGLTREDDRPFESLLLAAQVTHIREFGAIPSSSSNPVRNLKDKDFVSPKTFYSQSSNPNIRCDKGNGVLQDENFISTAKTDYSPPSSSNPNMRSNKCKRVVTYEDFSYSPSSSSSSNPNMRVDKGKKVPMDEYLRLSEPNYQSLSSSRKGKHRRSCMEDEDYQVPKKKKEEKPTTLPNIIDKKQAPEQEMPEHMKKLILEVLKGEKIKWVNTKEIYQSDADPHQNRLNMPAEVQLELTEEEKDILLCDNTIEVHVVDQRMVMWKLDFKIRSKLTKFVLSGKLYSQFTKENKLQEGVTRSVLDKSLQREIAQIWSFTNSENTLCFAINIVNPNVNTNTGSGESGVNSSDESDSKGFIRTRESSESLDASGEDLTIQHSS